MPNKADCSRCKATTRSGAQCTNTTCKSDLCWIHLKSQDHLRVKKSGIHGYGLFAAKPKKKSPDVVFKKQAKVTRYKGEVIDPEEKERRAAQDKDYYMAELGHGWVVDGMKTNSGSGRFANDCKGTKKKCNTKFTRKKNKDPHKEEVNLKAKKNIKDGEEVLVSYGKSYWSHGKKKPKKK